MKHDVLEFIGAVNKVKRLDKSGTSETNVIKCAYQIYKNKNPKNL